MYKVVLICVSLSMSFVSYAQFTESDTLQFGYRLNVNGSWITGNVDRLLINGNGELSHVGKVIGLKSANSYVYGQIFKQETENDIFSRNFIYLSPRAKIYPYAMLWLQNSKRLGIKFRHQAGLGVTYRVMQAMGQTVKVSATVTQEETRYNGSDFAIEPANLNGDEVITWRATIRLFASHELIGNRVVFHYETWYQPALDDSNNWRYYLNASMDVPFSKHFSFRAAVLYSHEQVVLTTIKRDDKIVTFGLNWSNF